jgi:GNAT superfamily N-acetyltransferase
MLGVRPAERGRGLARRLLDHVHELSASTPGSVDVTLTTEDRTNVEFYRHLGYDVVGHAEIAGGLETWSLISACLNVTVEAAMAVTPQEG